MNKQILQIAPTPFFSDRGCHIRIEGIVRCLNELGYENTVCTYHHGRNVESVKTKRIKVIAKYTQTQAGPSKYKLLADWRLLLLSIKEYQALKPAVIHAHLHEGLLIGLIVKWVFFWRRTPIIGDMQGSLSGELEAHGAFRKKPFLRWPVKALEWFLMKCANRIVCSSAHSLEKIQHEFSVNPSKISLAQDGADKAQPLSASRRLEIQAQWNLPSDKTLIVYSGALLKTKGLEELKSIIKSINADDMHFLIVGYPTENLQEFLIQQQLESSCTLTGQVNFNQLSDYLSLGDIAIDPKNNNAGEGSGKVLNYLACGLAVVAFNTINNRAFLNETSTLADNVEHFALLLNQLAKDKILRKRLATKNLVRFEENYSWLLCKKQLETVYSEI